MALVKNLIGLEHPSVVGLKYFFMSPNHLFFVQSADRVGIHTPNIIEAFLRQSTPPSYSQVV